jgi:exodeoxyribonuclease V gamma subunit
MAFQLARIAQGHQRSQPCAHDVAIDLGEGRSVTGTVNPLFDSRIVEVTYSRLAPKHKLQAWISLVALAAGNPSRDWSAVCVGRGSKDTIEVSGLSAPDAAPAVLRDLLTLFDAGHREPLPLPLKTSYAWAERRFRGKEPAQYARSKWETNNFHDGESCERAHEKVWGFKAPFGVLLDPPRPGEQVPGEDTRLGALAARLWLPMLAAERKLG